MKPLPRLFKRMQLLVLLALALACSACGVSSFKPQNWTISDPNDLDMELYRSKNLSLCYQQADQQRGSAKIPDKEEDSFRRLGMNDHDMSINKLVLLACMQSKGYKLRDLTDLETFISVVTAPFVYPLEVLGENFDDIY